MRKILISEIEKNRILSKHNSLFESFPKEKSTEERVGYINKRFEHIQNIFPLIENYMETKWGNKVEMKGSARDIHFGNENYSGQQIQLDFFIDETNNILCFDIKHEIGDDLQNLFGLNVYKYGEPLQLQFFMKKWEKL